MPASATRRRQKLKLYHATVQVTRVEEWSVEAASADEARALLLSGRGHRHAIGECLHASIDKIDE